MNKQTNIDMRRLYLNYYWNSAWGHCVLETGYLTVSEGTGSSQLFRNIMLFKTSLWDKKAKFILSVNQNGIISRSQTGRQGSFGPLKHKKSKSEELALKKPSALGGNIKEIIKEIFYNNKH